MWQPPAVAAAEGALKNPRKKASAKEGVEERTEARETASHAACEEEWALREVVPQ